MALMTSYLFSNPTVVVLRDRLLVGYSDGNAETVRSVCTEVLGGVVVGMTQKGRSKQRLYGHKAIHRGGRQQNHLGFQMEKVASTVIPCLPLCTMVYWYHGRAYDGG